MMTRGRLRGAFAVLLLAVTALSAGGAVTARHAAATTQPNILVIVTDDQTLGTVTRQIMPNAYHWFVQHGRTYPSFFDADPLCCPSRASIMTGRFDHNNGVVDNATDPASFHLDMRSEVQCYLQQAGYRTGLFGKFYNGYDYSRNPPCLTDYAVSRGDKHTGLWFRANGWLVKPTGWQDNYIVSGALSFLNTQAADPANPWYLYLSTFEPHGPYLGLPAYLTGQPTPAPHVSPSVAQTDLSGLDPAVRAHATEAGYSYTDWTGEVAMLRNVDRYIGEVFATLKRNGQLQNTLVMLVSDNGYLFGEHHLVGKRMPYDESIQVPFYMYGPKWVGGAASTDPRLAENVDITPTILQAAGVQPALRYPLDGRSLLDQSWTRPYALGESWHTRTSMWQPAWRSLRGPGFQYIEYLTDGSNPTVTWREYYDLASDPHEMRNLLADGDPSNDPDVALLHSELLSAASCVGDGCP